jgi:hypothetical protein
MVATWATKRAAEGPLVSTADMTKVRKERNLSGTYLDFLDDNSKRLKKPFQGYPDDAAGEQSARSRSF